ncbi:MAG: methyltransferase domain-containing protein [Pelistega sp.]|nr:methyltransferase domain-containing protein [Pelistega sp.]
MKNDASIEHFNKNAANWDSRRTSGQLQMLPSLLLEKIVLNAQDRVLDFGAGTGLLSKAIAPFVAEVTALDTSANMLAVLDSHGISNIQTVEQDIFNGLGTQHDLIVSSMAMHHVEDTQRLFHAFYQVLAVGGRLALIDLYKEDGSFHGDNEGKGVKHFGFVPEELTAIASSVGFQDIQFSTIHQLTRDNGRTYPLFLMQAVKY